MFSFLPPHKLSIPSSLDTAIYEHQIINKKEGNVIDVTTWLPDVKTPCSLKLGFLSISANKFCSLS